MYLVANDQNCLNPRQKITEITFTNITKITNKKLQKLQIITKITNNYKIYKKCSCYGGIREAWTWNG